MAGGWLTATRQAGTRILVAGGDWTLPSLARLDAELRAVAVAEPGLTAARLDLSDLTRLDTGGAWLLVRTERRLAALGIAPTLVGPSPRHAELLRLARATASEPLPAMPKAGGPLSLAEQVGRATVALGREAALLLAFFGRICITLVRTLAQPWRLRGVALVRQIELTGLDALPIVGLLSFLIGIVLAFQGADQLRRFGAEIFTVNLLGVSVLRELGVLLTAIIVAGRSGSAFTAQIGAMQVNQEVDALETIGLDPVEVLVLPRLLALMVTLPLLAFFASFMALVGGSLIVLLALDIPLAQVMRQLSGAISTHTLWVGLVKAPVFAFLIAMVGCFEGLRVTGSAESVGRLTTTSVVVSIFLVILVDALFSILFAQLQI